MRAKTALIIGISLFFSQAAIAAKPTSVTFKESKTNSEDVQYQLYVVSCSDGKKYDITSWNNRKLWCISDTISDEGCEKKQVKVAKRVCRSA